MSKQLEWRIVSVNVWGCFKVCDSEVSAKQFLGIVPTHKDKDGRDVYTPMSLANDPRGPYRLQSRPLGHTGERSDMDQRGGMTPLSPQQIARDMIARDRRMLERQKVAPKEKARRVLYRLFGEAVIVYLVGMAAAGAYVVVKGWLK